MPAILALIFILIALLLLYQANQRRRAIGLPGGRLVYSDTSKWQPQKEPLYDAELGLTGRPDYLIEDGSSIIPVEVKSSRPPHAPYDAHIYQLAAYCLLVEKIYGVRPPYGVLHYIGEAQPSRTFAVDFTLQLEQSTLALLSEMHAQEKRQQVPRSHESKTRCKGCGYSSICDQKLE
jgi:CRISPR-associated exonuclease Cas4